MDLLSRYRRALSVDFRFVSIEAGNDHLLAVTSKNRAFAHPVNKNANAYGQLGFRKFEIPNPSDDKSKSRSLEVELVPRSIADPYAKSSRSSRPSPTPTMSRNLDGVEDSNIRFCPHLFEIPVLRDVDIAQIAAGGRTSFARTTTGRVLGWGANEYG
jgi:alpha-tubulin suppressor-like RCC1 family protein